MQGVHTTYVLAVQVMRKRTAAGVTGFITGIAFAVLWATGMYLLDIDADWGIGTHD